METATSAVWLIFEYPWPLLCFRPYLSPDHYLNCQSDPIILLIQTLSGLSSPSEYSFIFYITFCDLVPAQIYSLIFCHFSFYYWITLSCVLSFSSLTLLQNSARHSCFRVRCFSSLLPKHHLYTLVLTVQIVTVCSYSPHPIPLHCGSSAVGIVLLIFVCPTPDAMPGPQ